MSRRSFEVGKKEQAMTDPEPKSDESVTEESGAGYGNNAETGGTEAPGEDADTD